MDGNTCNVCGGTQCLSQKGIAIIYLLPNKVALFLIIAGLLAWPFYSYAFVLSVAGYILPLVNADLRLLLYPYVAISKLFGRLVNCPKCEPSGGIFRANLKA